MNKNLNNLRHFIDRICSSVKLTPTKRPTAMAGLDVSVEFVLQAEGTDKKILSRSHLISKSYRTPQKSRFYRSRLAVRAMSIRAEKAASGQRVRQFTNRAEIAAHDDGNGRSRCKMQRHGEWTPKKAFCVASMKSNPYHRIKWIGGWVGLVFLGPLVKDAANSLRYPCVAKKKKGMACLNKIGGYA